MIGPLTTIGLMFVCAQRLMQMTSDQIVEFALMTAICLAIAYGEEIIQWFDEWRFIRAARHRHSCAGHANSAATGRKPG